MKLSEIQTMWEQDCVINQLNLGDAAASVPKLHAKYLGLLTNTKLQLRKLESDYLRLRKNKKSWYNGEMSREELASLGWEPSLKNKPLKGDMDEVIQTDEDVITFNDKYEYLKIMAYTLESIMKSIQSRGWEVKSAITWHTFTQGG